ncbi:MAG: hypothetical protein ABI560_18985, partial [Myxococcales bacterium]
TGVCPFGKVMIGLDDSDSLLACQSIPGNPITEVVDWGTIDAPMSGVPSDQNMLTCATKPSVL